MAQSTCTIYGCGKPINARGLCPQHYSAAKHRGELSAHPKRIPARNIPCKLDGCERPGAAHGYCQKHAEAYRLYGDPISPAERKRLAGPDPCSIDGCDRPANGSGMCKRHARNLKEYGHAIPLKDQPIEFWLERTGWTVTTEGCWEWDGFRNDHGYGIVAYKYRSLRAHRVMYESINGPLPDGQVIRHSCDNPPCVNPGHLLPGTKADNSRDMVDRDRTGNQYENKGWKCPNGHDMTALGAYKIVNTRGRVPYRTCVTCARTRSREYARRRRAALSGQA